MKHRTKLLLLAVMCVLALPLVLIAGSAWATTGVGVVATTGTYNTDASIQSPHRLPDANDWRGWLLPDAINWRGWLLPDANNFFCIATPSGYVAPNPPDGTSNNNLGPAIERDDLAFPQKTSVPPSGCVVDTATSNEVMVYYSATETLGFCTGGTYDGEYTTQTKCTGATSPGTWGGGITTNYSSTADAIAACTAAGYNWSGYSQTCGAANWTTRDPDNSPLPYYVSHKGCLRCHNTTYMNSHAGNTAAAKESYLKTGHKNMIRPVTPDQGPLAGYPSTPTITSYVLFDPDGKPYPNIIYRKGTATDSSGNRVYWSVGGWYGGGLPYLAEAGGVALHGYYYPYSCGRCHAAGWTSDAGVQTNKEPYVSFGTDIGNTIPLGDPNIVVGDAETGTAYSSFDRWGIECSRCHQATGDPNDPIEPDVYSSGHTTFPQSGVTTGGDITAMCANCHRQENKDIPEGYSDSTYQSAYPESQVFQPAGIMVHYGSSGSADSHGPVYQFLNSPHGQFNGTWGQIGCPPTSIVPGNGSVSWACDSSMSAYNSLFKLDPNADINPNLSGHDIIRLQSGKAGGCTSCHDVHYSISEATGQAAHATKACTFCHTTPNDPYAPQVDINAINHPYAPGTPLDPAVYTAGTNVSPCTVCHMPKGDHYFRINTDPSYSTLTWPIASTGTYANTAPDTQEGYTNAIWNDINSSCGQCHGGGVAYVSTTGSISSGAKTLTVANARRLAVGEAIRVEGAGAEGDDLLSHIDAISGTTITLADSAGATVSNVNVTQDYTTHYAPYMTKAMLASFASGMHNGAKWDY